MSAASWLIFVPVTSTSTFTPTPTRPTARFAPTLVMSLVPLAFTFRSPPRLALPAISARVLLLMTLTTALMATPAVPAPTEAVAEVRS